MTGEVICESCGKIHRLEETELAFRLPDPIFALSPEEQDSRCHISDDICAIDQERLFLRGLIPLPVPGREKKYNLGVWAEVDAETFGAIYKLWTDPLQADSGPYSGKLANAVPYFPNTVGLDLIIRLTGPTTRPEYYLQDKAHGLYLEQKIGISTHRILEYGDRTLRLTAAE